MIVPWVSAVGSFDMLEETPTQQQTVTSQKTRIFCMTAVETSGHTSTSYSGNKSENSRSFCSIWKQDVLSV
jgi:hypothetical protein